MKRIIAILLAMVMVFALGVSALADEPIVIAPAPADVVTVYYTNDVHTYIDQDNNYAKLATLYKGTENALLVDAGDHVQGTAYGGMDKGATIVKLMEAVGYDLATLGNHEFDYGAAQLFENLKKAEFEVVCADVIIGEPAESEEPAELSTPKLLTIRLNPSFRVFMPKLISNPTCSPESTRYVRNCLKYTGNICVVDFNSTTTRPSTKRSILNASGISRSSYLIGNAF